MTLFPTRFNGWLAALFLLLATLLCSTAARAADLQTIQLNRELGVPVTRYLATNGSTALRIQYAGTYSTGDAWAYADANGDLHFVNDAGSADTTVSTDGQIDVSGASEDTFGEVCDAINASANWRAELVDVLPSWSANNVLTSGTVTQDTDVFGADGITIKYNTADLDKASAEIGIAWTPAEILGVTGNNILNRRTTPLGGITYPIYRAEAYKVVASAGYSSGAPDLQVYAVSSDSAGATELLLWSQAGAASGSSSTIDLTDLPPLRAPRGWKLVAVYNDTSTPDLTTATLQVHGLAYVE